MNGRVQDSITGRFLSADPYITEPQNTQNYNRYSYVYNNPLTFTDPTGWDCQAGGYDNLGACLDEIHIYASRISNAEQLDRASIFLAGVDLSTPITRFNIPVPSLPLPQRNAAPPTPAQPKKSEDDKKCASKVRANAALGAFGKAQFEVNKVVGLEAELNLFKINVPLLGPGPLGVEGSTISQGAGFSLSLGGFPVGAVVERVSSDGGLSFGVWTFSGSFHDVDVGDEGINLKASAGALVGGDIAVPIISPGC